MLRYAIRATHASRSDRRILLGETDTVERPSCLDTDFTGKEDGSVFAIAVEMNLLRAFSETPVTKQIYY